MTVKSTGTWRKEVLFRLECEMDYFLQLATSHKNPEWRTRYLELHFTFVDAYIALKEQVA